MNINELTIGQAREIAALVGQQNGPEIPGPWKVGKNYFLRVAQHSLTGKLVRVGPMELTLVDAAWIADSGRYMQAVASGEFAEVEPYPAGQEVIVGRGAIVDATEIPITPRSQK